MCQIKLVPLPVSLFLWAARKLRSSFHAQFQICLLFIEVLAFFQLFSALFLQVIKVIAFASFVNSLITILGKKHQVLCKEKDEFAWSARKIHLWDPECSD